MLRSPLDSLGRHPVATAGVVLALAASMWLVAALGAAVLQVQGGVAAWWDQYFPVVYLDSTGDDDEVEHLRDEIESWSGVASVSVEDAEAMLMRLEEEFGEEEVRSMGVEASMMPTALVVEPRVWRRGEAEMLARLEAMEVRQSVMEVDAPAPGALSWMERGRAVLVGTAVAVIAAFVASLVGLASFLRHLQHRHRRENHLLELFGATPVTLRRPTFFRGLALGTAAGVVAGAGFLPWALGMEGFVEEMVGAGAMAASSAALWALVLVAAGIVLGAVAGWVCSRPRESSVGLKMESLLEWEEEAT